MRARPTSVVAETERRRGGLRVAVDCTTGVGHTSGLTSSEVIGGNLVFRRPHTLPGVRSSFGCRRAIATLNLIEWPISPGLPVSILDPGAGEAAARRYSSVTVKGRGVVPDLSAPSLRRCRSDLSDHPADFGLLDSSRSLQKRDCAVSIAHIELPRRKTW